MEEELERIYEVSYIYILLILLVLGSFHSVIFFSYCFDCPVRDFLLFYFVFFPLFSINILIPETF